MGVEIPQGDMNTNLITDTITSILAHLKAHKRCCCCRQSAHCAGAAAGLMVEAGAEEVLRASRSVAMACGARPHRWPAQACCGVWVAAARAASPAHTL